MKNYYNYKKEVLIHFKTWDEDVLLGLVNLYLDHDMNDAQILQLKHYSKALLEDLFHGNQITLEHRGKELKTQEELDKAFEEQWVDGYPSDPLDDEYLIIKPKKRFGIF